MSTAKRDAEVSRSARNDAARNRMEAPSGVFRTAVRTRRTVAYSEAAMTTKTVGIIGGIGPESTIDYYRLILAAYRTKKPDGSAPSIIINSIDLQTLLSLVAAN